MIDQQPLEVTNFSLGITDYFIDGEPNEAEAMDNLFLRPNAKPITRWGSVPEVTSQLPLGQFRISKLSYLWDSVARTDNLLTFAEKRIYTNDGAIWSETLSPTGLSPFDEGDANSLPSCTEWRGHIISANDSFSEVQKIFYDENSILRVQSAGLPDFPTSGLAISPPPGTGSTYSYIFIFRYEYMVGPATNLDRGPLTFFPGIVSGGTITSGNGSVINLPTSLPSNGNYDVANFQVEIYRTKDADPDYFLVDTVPFGTASYTDEIEDIALTTPIYSSTVSYKAPPRCKYVHVVNETGYYAHIKEENGEIDRYKILQSIPGDADSVPTNFLENVEQEITGLSSIFDRPIVLCTNYIYRIDSFIASDGTGVMDLRRIDDRAGCVSNLSVVQTHRGLFWAGEEGFFWTDGFQVKNISKHINETYQTLVSSIARSSRIYGSFDPGTERVFWSCCLLNENGEDDVDTIFVLDLKFTTLAEGEQTRGAFTTLSGSINFKPTATVVKDENLYRSDSRGYLFRHNRSFFSDPLVDITEPNLANWFTTPIIFDYKSAFIDFGSKFIRKFVPSILVSAANKTNLSLAIKSSNDNNRVIGELKPISYKNNITWGDSLPVWGDPNAAWNLQGIIEEIRRFPAGGLRCQYKQIQFTNDSVEIIGSTVFGPANVNSSSSTITLDGTKQFPSDLENYDLQVSSDGFSNNYKILSQSSNTLVVDDSGGTLVTGSFDFKVIGIPKNEILELNGYVINWAYLSKSHKPFIAGG